MGKRKIRGGREGTQKEKGGVEMEFGVKEKNDSK